MSAGTWIAVGLLGGLAASGRYVLDFEVSRRTRGAFPTGILVVNLLGAFLVGVLSATALDDEALTVLASVIGSFTTFSAWMLDTHRLKRGKRADLAWLNVGLPVVAGFLVVSLGHSMGSL
jgi:CrcB protein